MQISFSVEGPALRKGFRLVILGSTEPLGRWSAEAALKLKRNKKGVFTGEVDMPADGLPAQYKLAVFDRKLKEIAEYEPGHNRALIPGESSVSLPFSFWDHAFRGAGVNIQLSALKRSEGWGCGDLTDLKELIRWCSRSGFKMIQLLPLNDTTATFGDRDSYPYSPVSSKALHPQFLDVVSVAKKYGYEVSVDDIAEGSRLNTLEFEDQPAVMKLKRKSLRNLFDDVEEAFLAEKKWKKFYSKNCTWLVPFAVWCMLRDKHETADPAKWSELSEFDEEAVAAKLDGEGADAKEIRFHFFLQYHLHLALRSAVRLARKKGIWLKADLPIGMNLHSADVWQYPQYFHLDMQAGAPPDYFTPWGQNWGFPTYNWQNMEADGYSWFRERLQHPQQYFDAIRIDHVLGLFRIWSIPRKFKRGIDGSFPEPEDTWENEGRKKLEMMKQATTMLLCAEDLGVVPDFLEAVLRDLHILSLEVQQMGKYTNTELTDVSASKYESVVMPGTHDMATLREWWEADREKTQQLFTEVLNIEGAAPGFLDPATAVKIIELHLHTRAMWSVFLLQDILAMNGKLRRANPRDERINDPANDLHVWKWRMHLPTSELIADKAFSKKLKAMIQQSGRT